jgi:prepilin-type N-terminal cleavage/methylation domain-containing protein
MRVGSRRCAAGFTLIELSIVILIIGIMASLILVASRQGVRRAEERATQALVTKLETGMTDWLEALLNSSVSPNQAHNFLAATPGTKLTVSTQRAQVIARIDRIKAEMPDVFFVQVDPTTLPQPPFTGSTAVYYPLNFTGRPYPFTAVPVPGLVNSPHWSFVLPLGNALLWDPPTPSLGAFVPGAMPISYSPAGIGIYGASYVAAAGIYKNLGYLPKGYNGVDDNGNGFVDEWSEGIDASNYSTVVAHLQSHMLPEAHKTARSEMLYALLVEGRGPAGSVFNREDFTPRDVQDTDGDGLPEFVDAWGEPIQFYRWPTHFPSPIQKGGLNPQGFDRVDNNDDGVIDDPLEFSYYPTRSVARDQNPLDPNQQLVAPAWWSDLTPSGDQRLPSANAVVFQQLYFSLLDPYAASPPAAAGETGVWDRGGFYKRRAFFCRFLIASSGPDRTMGIARFNVDYDGDGAPDVALQPPTSAANINANALNLILVEDEATPFDPARSAGNRGLYQWLPPAQRGSAATAALRDAGFDDITNQTIKTPGQGLR